MSEFNRQLETADPADAALRRAIVAGGPAPPRGLEERILRRLEACAKAEPLSDAASCAVAVEPAVVAPAAPIAELPPPVASSPWSWRLLSGIALAAALLLGWGVWQMQSPALTGDQIANQAMDWPHLEQLRTQPWSQLTDEVNADYPFPYAAFRAARPTGWQACSGEEIGATGLVYRLTPGAGIKRGYLFVLPQGQTVAGLGANPQPQPLRTTGGWSLAAWQQEGVVYVLLAEGSDAAFRGMFRYGPVAA